MQPPCMLIAWIERHDPDVKEVRFTHPVLSGTQAPRALLTHSPSSFTTFPRFSSFQKNSLNVTQTEQACAFGSYFAQMLCVALYGVVIRGDARKVGRLTAHKPRT